MAVYENTGRMYSISGVVLVSDGSTTRVALTVTPFAYELYYRVEAFLLDCDTQIPLLNTECSTFFR